MSTDGLTSYSLLMTPAAWSALEDAANRTGQSRPDVVNVAVMVYAQLVEMGEHEGVYRATADDVAGSPLYLKVSRQPWEAVAPVDLTDAQLVLVLIIAPLVLCTAVFLGMLAADDWKAKRRARRVDPLKLDGREDPVEQAYADTPQQQEIARLRALAAADAAEGPARVELDHGVDELLVEIYKAQTQHRFPGIYGEDGQA